MAQTLFMVSGQIAGFAARQPRIAIGAAGLGGVLLFQLAAYLLMNPAGL